MRAGRSLARAAAAAAVAAAAGVLPTVPLGATAPAAADARRSGFADMTPATQALQRDDAQNPALLWVQDGAERYAADCVRCHGEARDAASAGAAVDRAGTGAAVAPALAGVATRYPAFDTAGGRVLTLGGRIDACVQRHVGRPPPGPESDARLGLEAFLGRQSRGLPIRPPVDARMTPWRERGERLWTQRLGQLQLSCAQCHDDHAGRRLGGSPIPQAHPTAYPVYRLEWQTVGALQRRLRNCMSGVRAEPFAWDSDAFTALESYLMQRAAGMPLETPGVRP